MHHHHQSERMISSSGHSGSIGKPSAVSEVDDAITFSDELFRRMNVTVQNSDAKWPH
ncbi:hypothetical protein DAPPUDRAFT_261816 [Daphnia pulex]|uniref:Uncharacterized protein n=1 Tax=Daphnia pulex TaxID=6669 RepID=E9HLQ6_DAPPU|nr:hypothetical protein DAPPUDRAFT_261816 [Daphnia pulex]|eukprot:EFX67337.1 hypothetical protein DAPPUDRAFT_261816 [Daphnia pulex]